eukprot:jgi/Astpho2/1494/Aster-x0477
MKLWVLGATVLSVEVVKRVFSRGDKEADCRAWPAFKLDESPEAQPTPDEANSTPVGLPAQQRPSLLLHPIFQLLAGLVLLNVCLWAADHVSVAANRVSAQQPAAAGQSRMRGRQAAVNLTGTWVKDKAASDSMDAACDAAQLNSLMRMAVSRIKGVRLEHSHSSFKIVILSGILWFKVVEEYPLSGEICRYSRRDRRKGRHRGYAYTTPEGDVAVKLDWDAPLSGTSTDTYSMLTPGVLQVDSVMQMGSKSVRTKGIYHLEN